MYALFYMKEMDAIGVPKVIFYASPYLIGIIAIYYACPNISCDWIKEPGFYQIVAEYLQ